MIEMMKPAMLLPLEAMPVAITFVAVKYVGRMVMDGAEQIATSGTHRNGPRKDEVPVFRAHRGHHDAEDE